MNDVKAFANVLSWCCLTGLSSVLALTSFVGTVDAYLGFVNGIKK